MDGYITFLVTICLSTIGGWYLQKSILKGQVMDHIDEHAKELSELKTKANVNTLWLVGEIERLKDDLKDQEKQIANQNTLIKDLQSKYEESIEVSIALHLGG